MAFLYSITSRGIDFQCLLIVKFTHSLNYPKYNTLGLPSEDCPIFSKFIEIYISEAISYVQ